MAITSTDPILKTEDVIDSRKLIERLHELEAQHAEDNDSCAECGDIPAELEPFACHITCECHVMVLSDAQLEERNDLMMLLAEALLSFPIDRLTDGVMFISLAALKPFDYGGRTYYAR